MFLNNSLAFLELDVLKFSNMCWTNTVLCYLEKRSIIAAQLPETLLAFYISTKREILHINISKTRYIGLNII